MSRSPSQPAPNPQQDWMALSELLSNQLSPTELEALYPGIMKPQGWKPYVKFSEDGVPAIRKPDPIKAFKHGAGDPKWPAPSELKGLVDKSDEASLAGPVDRDFMLKIAQKVLKNQMPLVPLTPGVKMSIGDPEITGFTIPGLKLRKSKGSVQVGAPTIAPQPSVQVGAPIMPQQPGVQVGPVAVDGVE